MKKLLAMLLVLMLALPCVALAEPSAAYTVALMNPVITYMGESIDMTGLDLELSAIVSDIGAFAATALVNVGQNFEHKVVSAQAQLDTNGLSFTADGMSNAYSVSLSELTGENVDVFLPMLSMVPVYSMLSESVAVEETTLDVSLSSRYGAFSELFAPYAENGSISIDKTEGELLVNQALTMLENVASGSDNGSIAELRAMRPAFDMNGSLTVTGNPAANEGSYTLIASGSMFTAESTDVMPYDITLTDSVNASNLALNLYEPGGTQVITIALDSTTTPAADGRNAVDTDITAIMSDTVSASAEEELATITYTATPVDGSRQMDYVFDMSIPSDSITMSLLVSNGTNGDDIGFATSLFFDDGYTGGSMYLAYTGAKSVDALGTAFNGHLSLGGDIDGQTASFDTGLLLRSTAMDTAEWVYDSAAAIALETMTEDQANTAMMGLMGIAGTAMTLINEHVPGLAPIIASMM